MILTILKTTVHLLLVFLLLCIKLSQTLWLKTACIDYLTVSVGQKYKHDLAGLSAYSHKAEIKELSGMHSHLDLRVLLAEFVFL